MTMSRPGLLSNGPPQLQRQDIEETDVKKQSSRRPLAESNGGANVRTVHRLLLVQLKSLVLEGKLLDGVFNSSAFCSSLELLST